MMYGLYPIIKHGLVQISTD